MAELSDGVPIALAPVELGLTAAGVTLHLQRISHCLHEAAELLEHGALSPAEIQVITHDVGNLRFSMELLTIYLETRYRAKT